MLLPIPFNQQAERLREFDSFSYKAQEVNAMMQEVLSNPTGKNLRKANDILKIIFANWESREHGENKELFHKYCLAWQEVIDNIMQENRQILQK